MPEAVFDDALPAGAMKKRPFGAAIDKGVPERNLVRLEIANVQACRSAVAHAAPELSPKKIRSIRSQVKSLSRRCSLSSMRRRLR